MIKHLKVKNNNKVLSETLITALILVILGVIYINLPPLWFVDEPLADVTSAWKGPIERNPDHTFVMKGDNQNPSVAYLTLPVKNNTRYLVKVNALGTPEVHIDFAAKGYDGPNQEFVLREGTKKGEYLHMFNSEQAPPSVDFRIFYQSKNEVLIQSIELYTVGKSFFIVKNLLVSLAFLIVTLFILRNRKTAFAVALCVFFICYVVYLPFDIPNAGNGSDCMWYVPTSLSILSEGNIELSEYKDRIEDVHSYGIVQVKGSHYNIFPIGTSLLSLPLVFVGNLIYSDTINTMDKAFNIAAFSAKIIAALSAALLFFLLLELIGNTRASLALSFLFAFATSNFGTHAGGLWSHNAVLPLFIAALYLMVAKGGRIIWLAAIPFALAYITRPTFAIPIILAAIYIYRFHRDAFVRFALIGTLIGILFSVSSYFIYEAILPPYYLASRLAFTHFFEALIGNLVSPNRGLFIFTPIFIFSIYGMYLSFRNKAQVHHIYRYLSIVVIAHWLIISSFPHWWAGYSYGQRFFSDMLPALTLLLYPVMQAVQQASVKKKRYVLVLVLVLASVFIFWSLFVQVRAVTDWDVHEWNATPNVDAHPERIWDWKDTQIMRGFNVGIRNPLKDFHCIWESRKDIMINGALMAGWNGLENWDGSPTRWMENNGTIKTHSQRERDVSINFRAISFYKPRDFQVYLNDDLINEQKIPTSFVELETALKLKEGDNVLRFYTPDGCQRPCDIPELKSKDSRCLSLAFQNITII